MSLAQIEAELERLSADELRRLAMKSWAAFVEKGGLSPASDCSEDDSGLLAELDQSVNAADAEAGKGFSGTEVLERIREWTTK
jgi:hypothetical protein